MLGYIVTFAGGLAVGALGKFVGDWLTDLRKEGQQADKRRKAFDECKQFMPDFFERLRADLRSSPMRREIAVAPFRARTFPGFALSFPYFEDEFKGLMMGAAFLEHRGFLERIGEMKEPFAIRYKLA